MLKVGSTTLYLLESTISIGTFRMCFNMGLPRLVLVAGWNGWILYHLTRNECIKIINHIY
jgi:hypothetical protein